MRIATDKATRVALFRGEALELTPHGLYTTAYTVPDCTPDNCEIHPCPPLPGPWLGGAYRMDGGVLVLTPDGQALLEAEEARIAAEQEAAARPVVPEAVSRFQARAALALTGHFGAVEALMSAPGTPLMMRLAWQDATEFRRDSPTVAAMAGALGLDSDALDSLFVAAKEIAA